MTSQRLAAEKRNSLFRSLRRRFARGESLRLTRGPEEELRGEKELHADAPADAEQLRDFALAHAIETAGNSSPLSGTRAASVLDGRRGMQMPPRRFERGGLESYAS